MTTVPKQYAIHEVADSTLVEVFISGELTREDYKTFSRDFDAMLDRRRHVRMLVTLDDFQGWTPGGAWEDLKFDIKHFSAIERIAVLGEETWEKWVTILFKPFTAAEVRYYDRENAVDARKWLLE